MRSPGLQASAGKLFLFGSLVACGYAGTLGAQPAQSQDNVSATEQYQNLPEATLVETWTFKGFEADEYKDLRLNLSGIAGNDHVLVIGADEGASIQVLKNVARDGDPTVYKIDEDIPLENLEGNGEVDIEALASDGDRLFVIGSHSGKRARVKSLKELKEDPDEYGDGSQCLAEDGDDAKEMGCWKWNRKRLRKFEEEPDRKRLFVLETGDDGTPEPNHKHELPLGAVIKHHDVLKRFLKIPSKENGIDIEGLAVDRDRLYVGFRGPVLRGPYAVVLVLKWEKADGEYVLKPKFKTRYLDLDGRGIRGMATVIDDEVRERIGGKLLVLAGPVGDEPSGWVLYRWDGKDSIPGLGRGAADDHTKALCRIPPPQTEPLAKAEGVMMLPSSSDREIRFLIVYDSAPDGGPAVFSCTI